MLKILRFFSIVWLIGLISVAFFNYAGVFRYAGVSRVDVFNSYSIYMTNWRFVYYKKTETQIARLPFMLESGAGLSWMKDEMMRYKTYYRLARIMRFYELNGNNFEERLFGAKEVYLPMLYDLCASNHSSAEYLLKIVNSSTRVQHVYKLNIDKNQLPEKLKASCEQVEKLPSSFKKNTPYEYNLDETIGDDWKVIVPRWNI